MVRRAAYFQSALKRSGFPSKKIPDVGCGGTLEGAMRAKGQSSAASPCAMRVMGASNVEEM